MKRHFAYPVTLFLIIFLYLASMVVVQFLIEPAKANDAPFAFWAALFGGLIFAVPLYFVLSPTRNRDDSVANVGVKTVGKPFFMITAALIACSIGGGAYVSYTTGKERMEAAEAQKKSWQKRADEKVKAAEAEEMRLAAMTPAERTAEAARKAKELAAKARQEKEAKEKSKAQQLAAEKAAEAAQNRIVSKLTKKHDEVEGTDWYQDKTSPKFVNQTGFYLYMGKKGSHVWLNAKIQYAANTWLFIHEVIIKADDKTFTWVGDFQRDHHSTIWEWSEIDVNKNSLEAIRAVANSKKTILRLVGRQYEKDRVISEQEKQAFRNVLEAYAALGGKD